MRHSYSFCPIVLALSFATAAAVNSTAEEPKLVPLFTGKDLTNFKAEGAAEFWLTTGQSCHEQSMRRHPETSMGVWRPS